MSERLKWMAVGAFALWFVAAVRYENSPEARAWERKYGDQS